MGVSGYFKCTAECGYMSDSVYVGAGMEVVYELRTCNRCGEPRSVVAARVVDGELKTGSRRGRCTACGGQSLGLVTGADRDTDAEEATDLERPCPRCQQPTQWVSVGLWD
jgi:hypothetical protein